MPPPTYNREDSLAWLLALTQLPTAAGREFRVVQWIRQWVADRADLRLRADDSGNLVLEHAEADAQRAHLYITAHLDHPAFVVEAPPVDGLLQLCFRGGVKDAYFQDAAITVHAGDKVIPATIESFTKPDPFRRITARIAAGADADALASIARGDVARWRLPEATIAEGILHAPACDDLAAVAAALTMLDALRQEEAARHVRLLLTRAEEIGFIGAIAACRGRTMPAGSRAVLLENSRSFADSPIGGGPIVRVGDRISTFSPALTAGIAKVADELEKQQADSDQPFRWQRKLMPGGACEATCFQAFGYEATCLCLPLGNYHNMANLAEVEQMDSRVRGNDGKANNAGHDAAAAPAQPGLEFIAIDDYFGLIDLLIACAGRLGDVEPMLTRLDKLFDRAGHVLSE